MLPSMPLYLLSHFQLLSSENAILRTQLPPSLTRQSLIQFIHIFYSDGAYVSEDFIIERSETYFMYTVFVFIQRFRKLQAL